MTISMITSFIFTIIFGWLSDYVSKLKILLCSLILFSLFLFVSFALLIFISLFFTSYMPILSRLFATKMRYTAIALIYNSAYSVASFIPVIASYLLEQYKSPLILSIILALISVIAIQNKKIL